MTLVSRPHSQAAPPTAGVKAPPRAGAACRPLLTLPEQIAEAIFTAIAHGEYAPGERVFEETLAGHFAVSRGPVREALRILERDCVVRIVPNKGVHVTQLSIKEVGELFELRRDLVGAMVRRLPAGKDTLIVQLDAEVDELEVLAKQPGTADAYVAISYRISRLLANGCGNQRLAEILAILARQTRRYSQLGLQTAARRKASARLWRATVVALKAGEMNAAATAIEGLIDASRQEAIRQLQTASSPDLIKDIVQ
jgi:DNA-binding GntR family transcriptional regulator